MTLSQPPGEPRPGVRELLVHVLECVSVCPFVRGAFACVCTCVRVLT